MELKSRSAKLPVGPALPVGTGGTSLGMPESGHEEKLRLLREQANLLLSLKSYLRAEIGRIKPVVKGVVATGFALAMLEIGGINLDQAQKKGGMALFAAVAAAKTAIEIKNLRRDIENNRTIKSVETEKLSRKEQEAIATRGSFERKTALLYNPNLRRSALDILLDDSQFQLDTVLRLNDAKNEARRIKRAGAHRQAPLVYNEIYVAASRMIERYMHTLEMLEDAKRDPKADVEQMQLSLSLDPIRPTLF